MKRDDAGVCVVEEDDEQDIEDDIRGQMREVRSKVEQGMVPPEAIDRWEKILRKYPDIFSSMSTYPTMVIAWI